MAHGIGTAKDLPAAAYWLSLAALQGYEHAPANRDYVLQLLTQNELDDLARRLGNTAKTTQHQDKQAAIQ
jgi:hypothetical protein